MDGLVPFEEIAVVMIPLKRIQSAGYCSQGTFAKDKLRSPVCPYTTMILKFWVILNFILKHLRKMTCFPGRTESLR